MNSDKQTGRPLDKQTGRDIDIHRQAVSNTNRQADKKVGGLSDMGCLAGHSGRRAAPDYQADRQRE